MDLETPPPDLYGRPRADRMFARLTAFGDWYPEVLGRPGLRRSPRRAESRPVPPLHLVVTSHQVIAEEVVELRLADPSGGVLPEWQPGARVVLTLPSGLERHYSLCGDPADRHVYRVAVRRIADGGGGSVEIHDDLHVGRRLQVRRPRNGFAFCGEPQVLFLAGGIGVTPLLPMARAAQHARIDWKLIHVGRTAGALPFTEELRALDPNRVEIRTDDVHGVPDAAELLSHAARNAAVYVCGPAPMLGAVQRALDASPAASLHFERFGAAPIVDGRPFAIRLGEDGGTVTVPADRSALDVARDTRPDLAYSCKQGFCGTCVLKVASGTPEHRDRRLTEEERAAGLMLPCVSRAAEGETLVLEV
ncbi:PDR/VanB family oxidoreductase [Kitasatospora sp. NPDC059795]|uniref:PDR/VanB family oxidoreductase n=1 Tax=Kitasatospora sp. NPDC059795 TaxID=3346949 RepID=UPI0036500EA5